MNHFIELRKNREYSHVAYYYNNSHNIVGDFSYYFYYTDTSWEKYRIYRGGFSYNKKPHCESGIGFKAWNYNGNWCENYEEHLMAAIK